MVLLFLFINTGKRGGDNPFKIEVEGAGSLILCILMGLPFCWIAIGTGGSVIIFRPFCLLTVDTGNIANNT